MALPAVSGAASGMAGTPRGSDLITLSNGLSLADIGDVFGAVTWDFGEGKVSEFSVPAVDLDGVLSKRGLLKAGVTLTYQGERWEVAAVERDYKGADTWLTFTARSQLARRLRTMTGPDKAVDVTPATWITSRVKKAGGVALVEPGAKRRTVVQKRSQSVLAVIEALASDTGVSWVEFDGRVFVGTPWWAFQGRTNLPVWQASARGVDMLGSRVLDAVGFNARSSLDDRKDAQTADLLVTAKSGVGLRPWHRVEVVHADEQDRGLWLVSNVAFAEGDPGAKVSLTRPLKSSPKKGSQGATPTDPAGIDGSLGGDSGWIEGADRVFSGCVRSPRQYVELAVSRKGSYYEPNHCARWVGAMTGARVGNAWAYYTRSRGPKSKDANPPRGSIVVWKPTGPGDGSPEWSGAGHGSIWGHVGIALGDGTFISATGGSVVVQSIAQWGVGDGYYGACAPSY